MPNGKSDEEKIILNGGVAEKVLGETCYTIKRHVDGGGHLTNAPRLVTTANALEDLSFLFQREVLDQTGFNGPYSHAINRQIDTITVSETEIRITIKPASGAQPWTRMTENTAIALITNLTIIIVALISRLWSHTEHKQGLKDGKRREKKIDTLLNGKLETGDFESDWSKALTKNVSKVEQTPADNDQPKAKKLTGKQRVFVNAYLGDARFNATEAARMAKYAGNDNTLRQVGYENLRKPEIAAEIAERINEHCASENEALDVLSTQMRGTVATVLRALGDEDTAKKLEENGADRLIKKLKIKSHFETNPQTHKAEKVFDYELEIHDAQAAAVHIGKHHKTFTDKHEIGGVGGGPLVIEVDFVQERAPETPEQL